MSVSRKYGLLRVIAGILKVVAWIVLAAGVAGVIIALTSVGSLPDTVRPVATVGTLAIPVIAIVWFVQLFAFGSVLSLLIDIEENTRSIAARPPE